MRNNKRKEEEEEEKTKEETRQEGRRTTRRTTRRKPKRTKKIRPRTFTHRTMSAIMAAAAAAAAAAAPQDAVDPMEGFRQTLTATRFTAAAVVSQCVTAMTPWMALPSGLGLIPLPFFGTSEGVTRTSSHVARPAC
jgi:DNA recombination-dependent growth factor C